MNGYDKDVTGTAVISIVDDKNDIYVVVCQKNYSGSHLQNSPFNLTGTRFDSDYGDKNPRETALRALKFFASLSTAEFSKLSEIKQTHTREKWFSKEQTDKDATLPALGFEGQIGCDFVGTIKVANISSINKILKQHPKSRSEPYLVNAKDISLITDQNSKYYKYTSETNKHLEYGQNLMIAGAFHLIEASVKNAMNKEIGNLEEFCNKTYRQDYTFSRKLESAVKNGVVKKDENNHFQINTYLGQTINNLYMAALSVLEKQNHLGR